MQLDDFIGGESGAVTVDWVVLTAALCGLGIATAGGGEEGRETGQGGEVGGR